MVRPTAGVSVDDALARWRDDLTARDCTPRSIERMMSIVSRVCECSGWNTANDVTYQHAVAFLAARRRQDSPWSNATHDQAVSTLRTFGEFLRRSGVLHANPLADLQSVGALNPQGARALTPDEARRLVACSIDRHLESRRAKGCAPLYWTVLFLTGLRVSEAASMAWSDIELDTPDPCIWTDPRWTGNKAGRRDRIPLHPELVVLLTSYRSSRMYRPGLIFPMAPTTATWNMDRDAAGIPMRDGRKRKATRHSARKSFITWLDALGIPRGLVSKLARHATTLTERVYVDHSEAKERESIALLGGVWPEKVEIFSVRAAKNVDRPTETPDDVGVKQQIQNTTASGRAFARSAASQPSGVGRSTTRCFAESPASARKSANGQVRTFSSVEDEVAATLARWLDRRADSGGSQEPTDDREQGQAV